MSQAMDFKHPEGQISFIAYTDPTERVAAPDGTGITVGIQTRVWWHSGIKVKSLAQGGTADFPIYRVVFDKESVGLKHDIEASILPSESDMLNALKHAYDTQTPVDIAIESSRRNKIKDTKTPIDLVTPIHRLMGAKQLGGQLNTNDTYNTTRKIVASVGNIVSSETRSNPMWWAELQGNKNGDIPPSGMRYVTNEDWTMAVITPIENQTPANPAPHAEQQSSANISAMVEQAVAKVIKSQPVRNGSPNAGRAYPGRIGEGRPFDELTAHGEVSFGSYANSAYRAIFEWASKRIEGDPLAKESVEASQKLTDDILAFSEHVQRAVYGAELPQPGAKSLAEATHWARWLIDNGGELDEQGATLVALLMSKARDYANHVYEADQAANTPPASRPATPPQSPAPQQSQPTPHPDQVKFVQYLNGQWADIEALRRAHRACLERGYEALPVQASAQGIALNLNGNTTLGKAIVTRGAQLAEQATPAPQPNLQAVPDPAPQPASSPANVGLTPAMQAQGIANKLAEADMERFGYLFDSAAGVLDQTVTVGDKTMTLEQAFNERHEVIAPATQSAKTPADDVEVVIEEGTTPTPQQDLDDVEDAEIVEDHPEQEVDEEKLAEAQQFAEEAVTAQDAKTLRSLQAKINARKLGEILVEDGTSDEPVALRDLMKRRRAELKES